MNKKYSTNENFKARENTTNKVLNQGEAQSLNTEISIIKQGKINNNFETKRHINKREEYQKIEKDSNIALENEDLKYLDIGNLKNIPKSELINVRESISLELLWIQQAIQSRIQVKILN